MKKIKFAVVGCGRIGVRHATMIKGHPEAELVALIDTDSSKEPSLKDTFGVPFLNSIQAFSDSGIEADVVNVCTPNGSHSAVSLVALEHNCHVVCEKPMALSKQQCEDVINKSNEVSKHVFCVMQNRYSPPAEWLKEVVSDGILGKIFMVQINCYWNRDERYYKSKGQNWKGSLDEDGGTLFTQFSHFVDIMYWLFGDITNIEARFMDFNHQNSTDFEDSGYVTFDFESGGTGCFNFSTSVYDKNLESSITIIAENGSIKLGGQYMNEVEYCHIKEYEMPKLKESMPPNEYEGYKGSASNHHFVIQNVVDTILGRTTATTNALEGLKVVDIIERIYKKRALNHHL